MPPPEGRASNHCVYIVSCLLLAAIICGGAFLMLYVTLPESEKTAWFPVAGMVLVCTPWVFWTVTGLYRTASMRIAAHGGGATPAAAGRTAAAAGGTAIAINEEEAMGVSPGGKQRVQLGAQGVPAEGDKRGSSGKADGEPEADGDSNEDCSSQVSHESELPLFAKT